MDHKVSKDMISSGMIPSGEKTQADLGRTQYGSAPSPNKLMDAYKSMYDKKGETLDEGLMDAVKNVASKVSNSNIGNPRKPHIDNIKRAREKGFFKGIKDGEAQATAELRKAGDSETLKSDRRERVTQIMNKNNQEKNRTGSRSTGESIDLLAVYRSVYEHHKKDADGNTIPHEGEELNEVSKKTLGSYVKKASTEIGTSALKGDYEKMKKRHKGVLDASDKMVKEETDMFDSILEHYLNEGYQREDILKAMSSLSEEPLTLAAIGGLLAKGGAMAAKGAAVAGKGLASAGKAAAIKGMGAAKSAASGLKSVAKTGMTKASDALGKVSNIAKDKAKGMGDTMTNMGKSVKDDIKNEVKRKIIQGDDGGSNKISKTGQLSTGSKIAASADLFDIVKGQLLDEGLSEEEIKDIMLTLTPDEIMEELSDTVKRNDALNRERAMKAAQERKVPDKVREASKRQYTAGGPKDKGENKYTTQDKKTIIDYNKDKGSM